MVLINNKKRYENKNFTGKGKYIVKTLERLLTKGL